MALCADRDFAQRVVDQVLLRSGAISGRWETDDQAIKWFTHFTVLSSRECPASSSEKDALLNQATSAASAALIASVRHLPMQQREAFLLCYGEQLDARQLATAMDCSSAAAANHLSSAWATLKKLSDDDLDSFITILPDMMNNLVPADETVEFQIQRMLARQRKWVWIRRIIKIVGGMVLAVVIVMLAWTAGRIIHGLGFE